MASAIGYILLIVGIIVFCYAYIMFYRYNSIPNNPASKIKPYIVTIIGFLLMMGGYTLITI